MVASISVAQGRLPGIAAGAGRTSGRRRVRRGPEHPVAADGHANRARDRRRCLGELDRAPMAHTICGVPIVLYRKLDRGIVALSDACPHRLPPPSMHLKEGDSLHCRYCGLLIGPDGRMEKMPVRSETVPRLLRAERLIAIERHCFIWVWIGDATNADPALTPDFCDFWSCSMPGWTFDGVYYPIACDYRLLPLPRPIGSPFF